MLLEGDIKVIDIIKEKKRLRDAGEPHEHIRPLLIIDGGLMKGVYGVGAGLAFSELGYADVFTKLGGVSVGAITVSYLLAGNAEAGKRMMYEECCTPAFMRGWRLWNMVEPRVLEKAWRDQADKGLDPEPVLDRSEDIHIGIAEFNTGKPVLFQPQTADELYCSLRATITMPGTTRTKTYIHGVRYSDGASTFPLAVERMIYDIDATHVLFITNQDKHTKRIPIFERFITQTLFRFRMPRPLRVAAGLRWETRHALVQSVQRERPRPVLFVWGDGSIQSFEQDPLKVEYMIEKSRQWWRDLLR